MNHYGINMHQKINKINIFENIPDELKPWFPDDQPVWFILGNITEVIKKIYETNPMRYRQIKENVYVDKTASIDKYVEIKGPALIGKRCLIRHGAFLRENVIIGDYCIVGNSTEVKNSVLFNNVEVPHFNYIGDSILGNYAHLGAGVIISNVLLIKNKRERVFESQKNTTDEIKTPELKEVKIKMPDGSWISTGYKKFGAIIGDYAEIGVNTTINPGSILEKCIFIPSSISIGGYFRTDFIFPKNIIYDSV
jgi:NDP-sugar pyrophosphorylase family protein